LRFGTQKKQVKKNERTTIVVENKVSSCFIPTTAVLLARRIVNYAEEGMQVVQNGCRFTKFGSENRSTLELH
jgi:phosphatidylserine decarboxylase